MFLRDTDFITLEDLVGKVHDPRNTWSGSSVNVRVNLTGEEGPDSPEMTEEEAAQRQVGTITLGQHEVPATEVGIQALGAHYNIPTKFLGRIPRDEQQFILDHRIQRSADEPIVIKYDETGLTEVYKAVGARVVIEQVVERMANVLPYDSQVVEWWSTPEDFRADVIVPEGFDRGIGGDRQVGDLTYGGIRVGQNRKQNLAPWTQTFMYRLACTNGMEVPDLGIRVDARGATDDEILAMFESEARRAFARVEDDIRHFYDLRSQRVDEDRTGILRRITQEQGLPDRTIGRMEDTLADALLAENEVSMFHLVNHITNQANDPSIRHRHNARRALERAGGQMISDHAARCQMCHSRLN